jgi:2-keto-4-pentenoate hydratase/2-oxohepta-3-ene-1,7-dioic acid hydratase in catechol pathway
MKIVSFLSAGAPSFGLLVEAGVIDVGRRLGGGLEELLAREGGEGVLRRLSEFAHESPDHALSEVALTKPLLNWGKCFCVGVNYPERNAEYKDGSEAPGYPSLFVRFPSSFVGPGEALVRPPESAQLDYEGEIALIIGKAGRRIAAADWEAHVFGYSLANEGTIRDWVRHGKFNVTPGKNWTDSGAIGPWITPFAEAGPGPFTLTTRVNDEVRQRDSTARLLFPFSRIIEYVSTFSALIPGDIILTGTPSGAGARLDPPVWLKPGDRVEVEVAELGRLSNGVRDEDEADLL